MMTAEAIAAIIVPVVTLTELFKFSGVPKSYGMAMVLALSAFGMAAWAFSQPDGFFVRQSIFPLFTGYAMVVASAGGVYGFIRQTRASEVMSPSLHGRNQADRFGDHHDD